MFSKVVLALVSAFLLVHCSHYEEVNTNTCDASVNKNQADSSCNAEKLTFRSAVLAKLNALADEPLKLGKKLLEEVVADTANAEHAPEADTEFLNRILKGFKDIETKPTQKAHLFLTSCYLFDFFKGPVTDVWKKHDIIYKESFERHDLHNVAGEFTQNYENFLEWLLPEINRYKKTLTEEEQIEIEKFKVSCKEFEEEIPFLRKLQCFMRMFEYFFK